METVELKNTVTEIRCAEDGLNSRMEGQRRGSANGKIKQWKYQSGNRKKKDEKKINRDSGTCGSIMKHLVFVSLEP